MSGRYPNFGPLLIAAAGIPSSTGRCPGARRAGRGEVVAIVGGQVIVAGAIVAHGERQSMASIEDKIEAPGAPWASSWNASPATPWST
jgi:hypothetical protein